MLAILLEQIINWVIRSNPSQKGKGSSTSNGSTAYRMKIQFVIQGCAIINGSSVAIGIFDNNDWGSIILWR
eukprot:7968893-Ditylum_brightwellii.AAC.1